MPPRAKKIAFKEIVATPSKRNEMGAYLPKKNDF